MAAHMSHASTGLPRYVECHCWLCGQAFARMPDYLSHRFDMDDMDGFVYPTGCRIPAARAISTTINSAPAQGLIFHD